MSTEIFEAHDPTYPKEIQDILSDMREQVDRDIASGTVDDTTVAFEKILDNPSLLIEMIEQSLALNEENSNASF